MTHPIATPAIAPALSDELLLLLIGKLVAVAVDDVMPAARDVLVASSSIVDVEAASIGIEPTVDGLIVAGVVSGATAGVDDAGTMNG